MPTIETLQPYINQHIPAFKASGAILDSVDDEYLTLKAPLSLNYNDHGNAFGGNLYNLALMAGWAVLFLECKKHMEKPNIVTRDAQIRYRHPVKDEWIKISCRIPNKRQWEGFFAHYEKTGKTSITLSSTIKSLDITAVRFDGVFVLLDE